ncbi:MAG: integrase core domain-containing protein [Alphaproteobacteria bacterium]|nr:integrase core domain-containing protein [Alphaproteobacteria bacterium]
MASLGQDYNHVRPHSSLGYLTPMEFVAEKNGVKKSAIEEHNGWLLRNVLGLHLKINTQSCKVFRDDPKNSDQGLSYFL